MADKDIILSLKGISKFYPGVVALDNISIDFKRGEVHALLGENGAGKSTLIKTIAGAITLEEGTIEIEGKTYKQMTPAESRGYGIEVIYQEFNLVPTLSAAENICLGAKISDKKLVDFNAMNKKAKELFDWFNINIDPTELVMYMTPAHMQIVEIAKSVSKDVKILIMDEPTAPLTVNEVEAMFRVVEQLKERGVTVIYISHRMEEIFRITDRVTVLRDGKTIQTLNTADTDRDELIKLMVGRELGNDYEERNCIKDEVVLDVKNLSGNGVSNISFQLHKGEILGFSGLVGCGRTEIMRVLYGAEPKESGEVILNGKPLHIKTPGDALANGIGLIPEDRKQQGVFLGMPIRWNVSISSIKQFCKGVFVDTKKENETTKKYCEMMDVKTPSLEQLVMNLSGGNQQKVVIAKTLAANSDIIIFDEPTRGIDVGAKQEIYQLMNRLVEEGKSIIMISSDMPELLGMSDRVVVLSEGKQAGIVNKEDFSQERILDLASGE